MKDSCPLDLAAAVFLLGPAHGTSKREILSEGAVVNRLQLFARNFSSPQWLLCGAMGTEGGQALSCPPLAASTPVSAQHSALPLSWRLKTAQISGLQSLPLGMEAAQGRSPGNLHAGVEGTGTRAGNCLPRY